MKQDTIKYENVWFSITPTRLWGLWHTYKEDYLFEGRCNYCHTYSHIWFEKEGISHIRHCTC